jgi:2EXR family
LDYSKECIDPEPYPANCHSEEDKTLLITPIITAIMFSQQDVREVAKQLKAQGMDSLDLSLPVVICGKEEPQLAKSLGELDVLAAYSTLVGTVIDSLDLAGLNKFRFRNYKPQTVVKAVNKGRLIATVDTKGRKYFIANPNVFFPIIQNPWPMRSDLPSFHGFKNLPTEIRHKIWALAAESRRLAATEVCTPNLLS